MLKKTVEESEFVESYFIVEQNDQFLAGEVLVVEDGKPVKGGLELRWSDFPMSALKFKTKESIIDFLWQMKDEVQIDSIIDCSKEIKERTLKSKIAKVKDLVSFNKSIPVFKQEDLESVCYIVEKDGLFLVAVPVLEEGSSKDVSKSNFVETGKSRYFWSKNGQEALRFPSKEHAILCLTKDHAMFLLDIKHENFKKLMVQEIK